MKFFKLLFSVCGLIILINSCDNEFSLPADHKDIPIIYGILQVGEPNHYIRIERAFIDPNLSPLETAQNPDSLYYENAVVRLTNLSTNRTFELQRVNAEDEGFTREEGVFVTSPNYIYKLESSKLGLQGGEEVELSLVRSENAEEITARTVILPPMTITKPIAPRIQKWTEFQKTAFAWKPESQDAAIFDLELVFKFQEKLNNEPTELRKVTWRPVRNRTRSDQEVNSIQLEEKISGDAFFQFIGESIDEKIPARRIPIGIDLFVYGGGEEVKDFFNISLANAGITGSQDPPVFSNISGEGRGIFSSKSVAILRDIALQTEARDSLLFGRFTRDLRFE